MSAPGDGPMIVICSGAPARITSVLVPLVAIGLVAARAATTGLDARPDDPVSPWLVAALTVVVGCWLGWRSPTQSAELRHDDLRCRNLTMSFHVDWDRVETLLVVRRGPLTFVDVRIRGHRRRMRIGAATRPTGAAADTVVDMIRAHPVAGSLLLDAVQS